MECVEFSDNDDPLTSGKTSRKLHINLYMELAIMVWKKVNFCTITRFIHHNFVSYVLEYFS
jgi:hypothetical protein